MKELARSYIEKRIQTTRNNSSDEVTKSLSAYFGNSHAEDAREAALDGWTEIAASYLNRDATLSVGQKAAILARAYTISAKKTENRAGYSKKDNPAHYREEARKLRNVAQGLKRAALRSLNT